ncbi:Isotrichodermin C-15 hydroxylase [Madurella mycetomatis]|uniref:Isotrichodermin C-15 hydroxylase n=1 Tax=Madurella mycetomatis TaxID=100816 RepID=A0A175WHD8_9PEZI|nr:Isotrichodermin C-15 hydroxylase [Madurella mycetomatis]
MKCRSGGLGGPKWWAASDLFWLWRTNVRGTYTREAPGLQRKYGNIVRLGPNRLMVDGSIAWTQVFSLNVNVHGMDEFSKVPNQLFPGDYKTIVAAPRQEHRRMRRQLNHAFSDAAVKEQETLLNLYVTKLVDHLEKMAKVGEAADIATWLNYTTFDIIGDLTFGESFHNLDDASFHPFVAGFFKAIRGFAYSRMMLAKPFLTPIFLLLVGWREIWMAITTMMDNFKLVDTKVKARIGIGAEPKDGRRDFVTYMMRETRDGEAGFSEEDIKMNSGLLIGAGSETTASAVSGFFFFAGMAPGKLQRLVDEIRSAYKHESDINLINTQHLPYLRACIEETLRVFPTVVETPPRQSPGTLLQGNWVPRGTLLHVNQVATMRNPESFVDPDNWCPERWLPKTHPLYEPRFEADNKAAFKPFSYGPRDCAGKNLAYAEMRLIICNILHRLDFELAPGQERWYADKHVWSVWEKKPLNVNFRARKDQ